MDVSRMEIMVIALAAIVVPVILVALAIMFIVGIVKNRPWLSLSALGIGLFGLFAITAYSVALPVKWSPHFSSPRIPTASNWQGESHEWHEIVSQNVVTHPAETLARSVSSHSWSWSIRVTSLIFIAIAALAFAIAKACKSGWSCGGFPTWPQMVFILLAGFGLLMFAGVRSVQRVERSSAEISVEVARQRAEQLHKQAKDLHKLAEHQIEAIADPTVDIEALEERFVGPKIPLVAPESPVSTSTPEAGEQNESTEQNENVGDQAGESIEEASPTEHAEIGDEQPAVDSSSPPSNSPDSTPEYESPVEQPAEQSPVEETTEVVDNDLSEVAPPTEIAEFDEPESAAIGDEGEAELPPPGAKIVDNAPSGDSQPTRSPLVETAAEATLAVKDMASSMSSFANAIHRAVDEYSRTTQAPQAQTAGATDASPKMKTVAISKDKATAKTNDSPDSTSTSASIPRPHWIDEEAKRIGTIQRQVVATDEYATVAECNRAADILLLLTTYDHLMSLVGNADSYPVRPTITFNHNQVRADGVILLQNGRPHDYRLARLASMGIGIDYIRREIAKREYVETVDRSFGPMHKLYVQIEFTPAVDDHLRRRWNDSQRYVRFAVVGAGAMSILALLGIVWGLLKVDTMTKGYYTKRLFFGVPLILLSLLAFYAFLVEMGVDLPH